MSARAKICQIVPTTFHGMSSGRATTTSANGTPIPRRGIATAIATPSGISMSSTCTVKSSVRTNAARTSGSRAIVRYHSRPTHTRSCGEKMSWTEKFTTVISGMTAVNATDATTGSTSSQARLSRGFTASLTGPHLPP